MLHHFKTQYRFSLRVGFGRRKSAARAVRSYFKGF